MFFLIGVILLIAFVGAAVLVIKQKIRGFSREFLGNENLVEGLKQIEEEANHTPLSVSGGDSIYLPRIQKDFPDFHNNIFSEKTKAFLTSYFNSLEKRELEEMLSECSQSVTEAIASEINDLTSTGKHVAFDNINFHKIAISNYTKNGDYATIKYQASLEYTGERLTQTKYEVSFTFMFKNSGQESVSKRCTYCGAPIDETATTCQYCGTVVVRNIEKTWKLSNYKKLI